MSLTPISPPFHPIDFENNYDGPIEWVDDLNQDVRGGDQDHWSGFGHGNNHVTFGNGDSHLFFGHGRNILNLGDGDNIVNFGLCSQGIREGVNDGAFISSDDNIPVVDQTNQASFGHGRNLAIFHRAGNHHVKFGDGENNEARFAGVGDHHIEFGSGQHNKVYFMASAATAAAIAMSEHIIVIKAGGTVSLHYEQLQGEISLSGPASYRVRNGQVEPMLAQ